MRRTILLADDSVTIRKIVELTFGGTDIRVESVGSGKEALERLKDLRPDLALLDVVMPGPTGYDVCRAIKASPRPVPVLLLAGTFEPFDAALARDCGSDGHVTKPFDARQLVERVETLLAAGSARRRRSPLGRSRGDVQRPRGAKTPRAGRGCGRRGERACASDGG
jgi:CheY-like chemotaxis protein